MCFRASWVWTGAAHRSYLRIFTGRYHKGNFSCSLVFLTHCPHPKDLALSPPGNPSDTHPFLLRLAQETVAGKRQKPSHKVNGKLTAVFSIIKTPKILLLE